MEQNEVRVIRAFRNEKGYTNVRLLFYNNTTAVVSINELRNMKAKGYKFKGISISDSEKFTIRVNEKIPVHKLTKRIQPKNNDCAFYYVATISIKQGNATYYLAVPFRAFTGTNLYNVIMYQLDNLNQYRQAGYSLKVETVDMCESQKDSENLAATYNDSFMLNDEFLYIK